MGNDLAFCEHVAKVAVYVELCVEQGNGRWLNWGIHAECVEKAHKLLGD